MRNLLKPSSPGNAFSTQESRALTEVQLEGQAGSHSVKYHAKALSMAGLKAEQLVDPLYF